MIPPIPRCRSCTDRAERRIITDLDSSSHTDNHKPILSSDHAPDEAQLTPSSASPNAYDLSYNDDGKYAFHGNRVTKENQYALIFDPERKAFVLHRVDSTFNMNLIRTPATSDAEALKDEYPHLDTATGRIASSSQADKKKAGPAAKGAGKGKKAGGAGMFMENKKTAAAPKKSAAGGNSNKKEAAAAAASSAGAAEKKDKDVGAAEKDKKQKQQAQQRNRSPVGSEDEDSDDGFIIEYPDPVDTAPLAVPPVRSFRNESPGPSTIRKFDDFLSNQAEESDDDADAEYEEEDFLIEEGGDSSGDNFKLPSPLGRNNNNAQGGSGGGGGGEEVDDDTPEDDELMAMLEEEIGEGGGGMDVDSESSVSEED